MTDANTIADRYIAIWNEADTDRRRALIAEAWAEDCSYIDPMMRADNREQIHALVTADRELTYNTVTTIVTRLYRKGRLDRQERGRGYAYHPVLTREEHTAAAMSELLEAAGDQRTALAHFVDTLASRERSALRRALGANRK